MKESCSFIFNSVSQILTPFALLMNFAFRKRNLSEVRQNSSKMVKSCSIHLIKYEVIIETPIINQSMNQSNNHLSRQKMCSIFMT